MTTISLTRMNTGSPEAQAAYNEAKLALGNQFMQRAMELEFQKLVSESYLLKEKMHAESSQAT